MKSDAGWTRVPQLTFLDVGGLASDHQQRIFETGHPPCDATVDSDCFQTSADCRGRMRGCCVRQLRTWVKKVGPRRYLSFG